MRTKILVPAVGAVLVAGFLAVTAIDSVDKFLTGTDDAQSAIWEALKMLLLIAAAAYAWYEFVYKQADQSDERIELQLAVRETTAVGPRTILVDVEVENVGKSVVPFSRNKLPLGPELLIYLYDESAVGAVARTPNASQLLPVLAYSTRAYPFVNSDGTALHSEIEPSAVIRSTVCIVIPNEQEPILVVGVSFRLMSDRNAWITDTASPVPTRADASLTTIAAENALSAAATIPARQTGMQGEPDV